MFEISLACIFSTFPARVYALSSCTGLQAIIPPGTPEDGVILGNQSFSILVSPDSFVLALDADTHGPNKRPFLWGGRLSILHTF